MDRDSDAEKSPGEKLEKSAAVIPEEESPIEKIDEADPSKEDQTDGEDAP